MRYFNLALLLICFSGSIYGQWYSVPDSSFRNKLIYLNYTSCLNATHDSINSQCGVVQNTTVLNLANSNIHSLQGIQAFSNLAYLECQNNQLDSLPGLPINLLQLECQNNKIKQLPPLPSTLRYLNCSHDSLIGLTALPATLGLLACEYNAITSIPPLSTLPGGLYYLSCGYNPITCLPYLHNMSHLKFSHTLVSCIPNYVQITTYCDPLISSLPLCMSNNSSGCAVYCNSYDTLTKDVCINDVVIFNNQQISNGGTYYDTLPNHLGCDSIIVLHLTFSSTLHTYINAHLCGNDTFYLHGKKYFIAGSYTDTLISHHGCDSVLILHLAAYQPSSASLSVHLCQGDTLNYFGHLITTGGTGIYIIPNYLGCDSMVFLTTLIDSNSNKTYYFQLPAGTGFIFNGHTITSSGVYSDTMSNYQSCDSIVTVYLLFITGLNQPVSINKITQVYPNPFNSVVNFQSILPIREISIKNMLGQLIANYSAIDNLSLSTSGLSQLINGTYLAELKLTNNIIERIIIVKQ